MGRTKPKPVESAAEDVAARGDATPTPRPAAVEAALQEMLEKELERTCQHQQPGRTLYALAFDPDEDGATVFFHGARLIDDEPGEEPYLTSGLLIFPDNIDAVHDGIDVNGTRQWRSHPHHLQLLREIEALVSTWDAGPWTGTWADFEQELANRDAQLLQLYHRYATRYPGLAITTDEPRPVASQ